MSDGPQKAHFGKAGRRIVDPGAEDCSQRLEVVLADGQDPSVEVLALDLDDSEIPPDKLHLGARGIDHGDQVDDHFLAGYPRRRLVSVRFDLDLAQCRRKQLVDGYVVELGKAV